MLSVTGKKILREALLHLTKEKTFPLWSASTHSSSVPQHLSQMCCGISVSTIAGYLTRQLARCLELAAESQCEARCILIDREASMCCAYR